jgi:23S rRNA pseudoU1915 N3-methylase RlmH
MQKVILLCAGECKSSWIKEGCKDYGSRLQHELQFEVTCVPASKERDPKRQSRDETGSRHHY